MCYYGLTSAAATLTSDLYLNYMLVSLLELPVYCTVLYGVGVGGASHVVGEVQTQTQEQAPLIRQGSGDPRLE